LVFACLLLCACHPATNKDEPLTAEAKAYVRNLKLSEVAMQANESYGGQVVTEIVGKITNNGDRTVEHAEVACVFYDSINQLILRERVPLVKAPLKPGETRSFRLPFDDIPGSWNNQMPQLVIAQIKLS
jgi:hypothetical protein